MSPDTGPAVQEVESPPELPPVGNPAAPEEIESASDDDRTLTEESSVCNASQDLCIRIKAA